MFKQDLFRAAANVTILSLVIFAVSFFFLDRAEIGFVLVLLGFVSLTPALVFNIPFKSLWPDIFFGLLDNGILAVFIILGADIFGLLGAVVGGVVGNAVTDGFAGIFEGHAWQLLAKHKIKDKRTSLSVAIGKLAGCLFGAGIILIINWLIESVAGWLLLGAL